MRCRMIALGCGFVIAACSPGEVADDDETPADIAEATSTALSAPAAGSGALYFIRLVARPDHYAFHPQEVRVRPGDVVRFVNTDHQPESIAFDRFQVTPEAREFVEREGLQAGPLLTGPGDYFDVSFDGAPPGTYPFSSAAHREHGMTGRVIVAE
jgi:plastocyanin